MTPTVNIPPIGNEQRFAVVSIDSPKNVICIAPTESYCHAWCSRQNEHWLKPKYEVVPYIENVTNKKNISTNVVHSSAPTKILDLDDYYDEDYDYPYHIHAPIEKQNVKSRVAEYLKKTKKST